MSIPKAGLYKLILRQIFRTMTAIHPDESQRRGERVSEQSDKQDNGTPITRTWRLGGPMKAAERKEAKALFLEALKRVHTVSLACDYAVVGRNTVYQWREHDSTFADAWEDAVERSKDIARMSMYQRGILGWDEPQVSQGQLVYEYEPVLDANGEPKLDGKFKPILRRVGQAMIHKWSDTLAMGYARANLPEYKDKQHIDLTAQITTIAENAKDELLADLAGAIANEDKEQTPQE